MRKDLENQIKSLRQEVKYLRESLPQNVIFVKEVPFEKAKKMVLDLIKQHKEGIYTTDIAKSLHLDVGVVLKTVSELIEEDKIAKGD